MAHPPIVAKNGLKPIGPYSPALLTPDMVYLSGVGALDAQGKQPVGFANQVRQTLANMKDLLDAAGITPAHVVAVQLYLSDLKTLPEVDEQYNQIFAADSAPARVVVGVSRMPAATPIEITVVAVRDLAKKQVTEHGVWAGDRFYFKPVSGGSLMAAQRQLQMAARAVGLNRGSFLFMHTFTTAPKPTVADIPVAELPGKTKMTLFAVAARRPGKLMRDGCRDDGTTLYCESRASSGTGTVEEQTKALLNQIKERVTAHGYSFAELAATNVWINSIDDFAKMNPAYASVFGAEPPTRTTIQSAPAHAGAPVVRISVVAVHAAAQ